MTVRTVRLAGKRFVIVAESDFRDLERRARGEAARVASRDRADVALACKRLADASQKPVPYEQVRQKLGLK